MRHAADQASKPWLLLIPGLLCDAEVWAEQVHALSGLRRCVVAEHGLADSIEAMARQALGLLPEGVPFDVAGHSMGGRCALELLRHVPQRVARLALLDTGFQPRPDDEAGEAERRQRLALLELARSRGMRAMGQAWLPGMLHPAQHDSPLADRILAMIERSSPAQFEAQVHALLNRPDAGTVLARVQVPTLLLCGREDRWSPLARHEEMAHRIPGAVLTVVERCGHMSPMEQPQAVAEALRTWLGA